MTKRKHLIAWLLLPLLLLAAAACEETTLVETGLDYQEYTVVEAELKADSLFEGVRFTRTLPFGAPWSIEKAELKNVVGYIKINELQIIPLHYYGDGLYNSLYDLYILPEATYELFAEVDGKTIYAKTRIPERPEADNVLLNGGLFLQCDVFVRNDESYGAVWAIGNSKGDILARANDFFSVITSPHPEADIFYPLRTQFLPDQFKGSAYENSTYLQIFAYDKPFVHYFQTRENNEPVTNTFSQGGGNIVWNVYGENVMGIFIGVYEGPLMSPPRDSGGPYDDEE